MDTKELALYDFTKMDASLQPIGTGRSSGLHLSGLVKSAVFRRTGKESKAIEGEQDAVRMQAGFLWERAMEYAFTEYMQAERKTIKKQVKVTLDEVTGSPDGVCTKDNVLEEYKLTWRSMKRWNESPEENFLNWFMQVKGYLWMLGLTKVRFFIFWVNGDYTYKPGRGPQVTTQEFEFTQEELQENWQELMAQKPHTKEEVHG